MDISSWLKNTGLGEGIHAPGYYPRKNKQGAPSTWPSFVGSKESTYSQDFSPKREQENGMGISTEKILETPRFSSQAEW